MFGRGKPWQIWWITCGSPNFIIEILTMSLDINKKANKQEFTKALLTKVSDGKSAKVFLYLTFALCGMLLLIHMM